MMWWLRGAPVICFTIALAALFLPANSAKAAERIPMIDAHSQIDHAADLTTVVELLDRAGISRVILSARGKRRLRDIVRLSVKYPDRVTASIRLKGKKYETNDPGYYKKLKKRLNTPGYGAIAEALIWHAKKGQKARSVAVPLTSPQVAAAFKAARSRQWPFVVHIEFASAGNGYKEYMAALESFLQKHPDHPVALIHMGQMEAPEAARLIEAHRNIYFLTSRANPLVVRKSNQPWVDLFQGREIAPAWRDLMIRHPDRFVLAFDNVWAEDWGEYYVQQAKLWQDALQALPPGVAHAIGHGNAERLWRLPPAL